MIIKTVDLKPSGSYKSGHGQLKFVHDIFLFTQISSQRLHPQPFVLMNEF